MNVYVVVQEDQRGQDEVVSVCGSLAEAQGLITGRLGLKTADWDRHDSHGTLWLLMPEKKWRVEEHEVRTSALEIQRPTKAQAAGKTLTLEETQAMLAKMTVYAEQVEHRLADTESDFRHANEAAKRRISELQAECTRLVGACDAFEGNSQEASEVFEVLIARQRIPMVKPGPSLAEVVTKALDELETAQARLAEKEQTERQLMQELKSFAKDPSDLKAKYATGEYPKAELP